MNASLLSQGVELMLLGMGTVFVFLTLLVLVTTFMSSIVQKCFPETLVSDSSSSTQNKSEGLDTHTLIAVISAAIHQHRSTHKQ